MPCACPIWCRCVPRTVSVTVCADRFAVTAGAYRDCSDGSSPSSSGSWRRPLLDSHLQSAKHSSAASARHACSQQCMVLVQCRLVWILGKRSGTQVRMQLLWLTKSTAANCDATTHRVLRSWCTRTVLSGLSGQQPAWATCKAHRHPGHCRAGSGTAQES